MEVQNNNIVEVAKCLAQGAPATWRSPADLKTPLHFAAMKSDILVAQLLILNGAQVHAKDSENKSPLWYVF